MCWCNNELTDLLIPKENHVDKTTQIVKHFWEIVSSDTYMTSLVNIALQMNVYTLRSKRNVVTIDYCKIHKINKFYNGLITTTNKSTLSLFDSHVRMVYDKHIFKKFARECIKNGQNYDIDNDPNDVKFHLQCNKIYVPCMYDLTKIENMFIECILNDENIIDTVETRYGIILTDTIFIDIFTNTFKLFFNEVMNGPCQTMLAYHNTRNKLIGDIDIDYLQAIRFTHDKPITWEPSSIKDMINFIEGVLKKSKGLFHCLKKHKTDFTHVCDGYAHNGNKYKIWFDDHINTNLDNTCDNCKKQHIEYTRNVIQTLKYIYKIDKSHKNNDNHMKHIMDVCKKHSMVYMNNQFINNDPYIKEYIAHAKLTCAIAAHRTYTTPQLFNNSFMLHETNCNNIHNRMITTSYDFNESFIQYIKHMKYVYPSISTQTDHWMFPHWSMFGDEPHYICTWCKQPKNKSMFRMDTCFPLGIPPLCKQCEIIPNHFKPNIHTFSHDAYWSRCRDMCLIMFHNNNIPRHLMAAESRLHYLSKQYKVCKYNDIWQAFYNQKGLCCVTNTSLHGVLSHVIHHGHNALHSYDAYINESSSLSLIYISGKPKICFSIVEPAALEGVIFSKPGKELSICDTLKPKNGMEWTQSVFKSIFGRDNNLPMNTCKKTRAMKYSPPMFKVTNITPGYVPRLLIGKSQTIKDILTTNDDRAIIGGHLSNVAADKRISRKRKAI